MSPVALAILSACSGEPESPAPAPPDAVPAPPSDVDTSVERSFLLAYQGNLDGEIDPCG